MFILGRSPVTFLLCWTPCLLDPVGFLFHGLVPNLAEHIYPEKEHRGGQFCDFVCLKKKKKIYSKLTHDWQLDSLKNLRVKWLCFHGWYYSLVFKLPLSLFRNLIAILILDHLNVMYFLSLESLKFFSFFLVFWNIPMTLLTVGLFFFIHCAGYLVGLFNLETHVLQFWEI